jgi:hypothetical protein
MLTDLFLAYAFECGHEVPKTLPYLPTTSDDDATFGFLTPAFIERAGLSANPLRLSLTPAHEATSWEVSQQEAVGSYLQVLYATYKNQRALYPDKISKLAKGEMKEAAGLWKAFMIKLWRLNLGGMKKIREILDDHEEGLDNLVAEYDEVRARLASSSSSRLKSIRCRIVPV